MTEQPKPAEPTAYELYRSYKCARAMGAAEPERRNMDVERIAYCKGERRGSSDTATNCGWSKLHRDRAWRLSHGTYSCPSNVHSNANSKLSSRMEREDSRLRAWELHNPRLADPDIAARILRRARPREFVAGVVVIPGNGAPVIDGVSRYSQTHELFKHVDWKHSYRYDVIVCGDRWARGCEN